MAADETAMRQHTFSEALPDATLHFQIIDIGRQLYVWMSMGTANLTQLAFGIQTAVVRCPLIPRAEPRARRPSPGYEPFPCCLASSAAGQQPIGHELAARQRQV
jgi:hypothetical protein